MVLRLKTEKGAKRIRQLAHLEISLDLLTVTVFIHSFGGFESPLPLLTVFHMVAAVSVLRLRGAFFQAGVGITLLALLGAAEYHGVVPHHPLLVDPSLELFRRPDYLYPFAFCLAILLPITVYLSNRLLAKVQRSREVLRAQMLELRSFYQTVRLVGYGFEILPTFEPVMERYRTDFPVKGYGLFLINPDGNPTLECSFGEFPEPDSAFGNAEPVFVSERSPDRGSEAFLTLSVGARNIGYLTVSKPPGEPFRAIERSLLKTIAANSALSVVNAEAVQRLEREAITDGLTGLYNYRHFYQEAERELSRAERTGMTLALCLIDIDRFKSYNDCFGHLVGDQILRELSEILSSAIRGHDLVARYGGEEFTVMLPATELTMAARIADRLRRKVDKHRFSYGLPAEARHVTVSVGVACFDPLSQPVGAPGSRSEAVRRLVEAADMAQYEAKREGGNCTVVSSDHDEDTPEDVEAVFTKYDQDGVDLKH